MRTLSTAVLATVSAMLIACNQAPPPQIIYVPVQPGQVINQQGQPFYPPQQQAAPESNTGNVLLGAAAGVAAGAAAMHLLNKPGPQPLPPVNVPTIGTPDSGRRAPVIAPVAPAQAPVKAPTLPPPAALPPKPVTSSFAVPAKPPTSSFAVPNNYKITSAPKPSIPTSFARPKK